MPMVCEITFDKVGISKDCAHAILKDNLGMHSMAAKVFGPKLLSYEQQQLCLVIVNSDHEFLKTTSHLNCNVGGKAEGPHKLHTIPCFSPCLHSVVRCWLCNCTEHFPFLNLSSGYDTSRF